MGMFIRSVLTEISLEKRIVRGMIYFHATANELRWSGTTWDKRAMTMFKENSGVSHCESYDRMAKTATRHLSNST